MLVLLIRHEGNVCELAKIAKLQFGSFLLLIDINGFVAVHMVELGCIRCISRDKRSVAPRWNAQNLDMSGLYSVLSSFAPNEHPIDTRNVIDSSWTSD
jgi:hypothetical protein